MILYSDVNVISKLLTPISLLEQVYLPSAEMILPPKINSFDDLLANRNDIRMLKLLPIKSNEARDAYHLIDQKKELELLNKRMLGQPIALEENKYPYLLPYDTAQSIIWLTEDVKQLQLLSFISQLMLEFKIDPASAVMFERPSKATTPLVKGSFAHMRHIHLWTRVKPLVA
jgi:hypothetical protein